MPEPLTTQIQTALRKAGITLHVWTPEQARHAVGHLSAEAQHKLDSLYEQQLKAQISGGLPDGHVYEMGLPDRTWLATGISHTLVRMTAEVVEAALRSLEGKHRMQALSGLAAAMRRPAAIFRLDEQTARQSVLVCIDRPDFPLMLKVDSDPATIQGLPQVTVDAVYPLQPEQRKNWLQLIQLPGKALYLDKQQVHHLIRQFRDQSHNDKTIDYRTLTETVAHFENPQFEKQVTLDLPSFYSNAEFALESIRQDKAAPAQWLAMLQKAGGIKTGEDQWTGLSEWLQSHKAKTLSRDEIRQYIQNHRIRLGEVDFHEPKDTPRFRELQEEFRQLIHTEEVTPGSEDYKRMLDIAFQSMVNKYGEDFKYAFYHEHGTSWVNDNETAGYYTDINAIQGVRLRNTTDGLDSCHELAFFVEGIEPWQDDDIVHFGEVGKDQPGQCIGWVRFGEKTEERKLTMQEKWERARQWPGPEGWSREVNAHSGEVRYVPGEWDADGEKVFITEKDEVYWLHDDTTGQQSSHDSLDEAVDAYIDSRIPATIRQKTLFIDEIQSNRHQEGREYGYRDDTRYQELKANYVSDVSMFNAFQDKMTAKYGKQFGVELKRDEMTEEEQKQCDFLRDKANHSMTLFRQQGELPPPAPFEKNWQELCMKRMLRYAVDNGFDRMAWTTGEAQGNRYQMGTFLNGLKAMPTRGGIAYDSLSKDRMDGYEVTLNLTGKEVVIKVDTSGNIKEASDKNYARKLLSDVIGKRLATRVLSGTSRMVLTAAETGYMMNIEGMRTFYDTMLPSFMNKYGKKWGMKVYDTHVPQLGLWHMVDITPSLCEAVKTGQPMFMLDKEGHVLGLTLDDQIYITPDGLNPETLIHEYTHVWATAMRRGNPEGWQAIKDLLGDSPVRGEIIRNPAYADIRGNEDALAAEVLAHISGRVNAGKLASYEASHPSDVMGAVREALKRFWSWVGTHLFDLKHFSSIDEVTDRILHDLVSGTVLEAGKPLAMSPDKDRLSAITVYRGKNGEPFIRCKIDGMQQMGRPLKGFDRILASNSENLYSLANIYFRKELETSSEQKSSLHR